MLSISLRQSLFSLQLANRDNLRKQRIRIRMTKSHERRIAIRTFNNSLRQGRNLTLNLRLGNLTKLSTMKQTIRSITIGRSIAIRRRLANLNNNTNRTNARRRIIRANLRINRRNIANLTNDANNLLMDNTGLLLKSTMLDTRALLFTRARHMVKLNTTTIATILTEDMQALFRSTLDLKNRYSTRNTERARLATEALGIHR